MADLLTDIKTQTEWIVRAFKSDKQKLDFTLDSLKTVDEFFDWNVEDGKAKPDGRLAENLGPILFSIAGYVGETIIRNSGGAVWVVDDHDPEGEINIQVKLANGTILMPTQRVLKRFKNGPSDSLHSYGLVAVREVAREDYWEKAGETTGRIDQKRAKGLKPWWKFWEK